MFVLGLDFVKLTHTIIECLTNGTKIGFVCLRACARARVREKLILIR